jgi:DNA polymerase III sliding clamp (beta) subunit (PCNA family)
MTLQIKSRLFLSELEFVASCVERKALAWYYPEDGKLNIVARNGSVTIRSAVPLVEKDAEATFAAQVLALSNIVRMNHSSIAQVDFNEYIKVGKCSVYPFVGPPLSWIYDTTTCSTKCLVSTNALRNAIVAAKRLISAFQHEKYSNIGIGLILQNGQLMVNAISIYCISEHSVATVPSSECFRTFIPTNCLKAILNIGFGATSAVEIGVQDNTVQFQCGPRSVVIERPEGDPFTIDKIKDLQSYKACFATGAADLHIALARICAARGGRCSVTTMEDHREVCIAIPFIEHEHILDADELIPAHCWNELSVCLKPLLLLKFLNDANGAVLVYISGDKSRVLVQTSTKRLLLVALKSTAP